MVCSREKLVGARLRGQRYDNRTCTVLQAYCQSHEYSSGRVLIQERCAGANPSNTAFEPQIRIHQQGTTVVENLSLMLYRYINLEEDVKLRDISFVSKINL